ncbi:MAG: prohibitin family protein, partial [Gomphosphaeria aponina SAG 52.96 = DSM 107014]|nr:prohibitin family protein [Gomphosphaeria aponina SAG 52.96 = DSM 107014]
MTLIISTITALVAFLIALTRINAIAGENNRNLVKAIALLIGLIAACTSIYQLIFRFLVIIPAGTVGVLEILGKLENKPLQPGVHFLSPFSEVKEFSTRLKDIKEAVSVTSKEGLNLNLDVSLQYRLDPQQAVTIYQNIGTDEQEIVISRFRSVIREVTSSYDASAIYGEKRQEVAQKLQEKIREQLTPLGFVVEEALLRDVALPETIQVAIQEKLKAQQESQQQQFINEKERQALEFSLEQTKKEAERKKIEAQGIADAQKLLTTGLTQE